MSDEGWIGVDLDGTLAYYKEYKGIEHIGEPIVPMAIRVINWIAQGKDVRIFTARASIPEAIPYIEAWCEKYLGRKLPVTNVKDFKCLEIWDDRAVGVILNYGQPKGYGGM